MTTRHIQVNEDRPLIPVEPTPIEKPLLSVLIRIGLQQHPQHFGYYWSIDKEGDITSTCALGAAAVGLKGKKAGEYVVRDLLMFTLGWSSDSDVQLPAETFDHVNHIFGVNDPAHANIWSAIIALNDDLRWTREQIADWLQSIGY